MRAPRSRGRAPVLDDELRSCLATIVGYAVLLDSDDPRAREGAPRQIVASIQHLSETLERRAKQLADAAADDGSDGADARQVLVIDDDPGSRSLLRRMLPTEFELLEADGVDDGLRLAGTAGVELVVLSWRASTFSGPEALAELKISYPRLGVIVIADANDDMYEGVAEALGADSFLVRPLNSLQLLAAADDLLRSGDEPG
jgi:PleD family two-component response regulator